VSLPPEHDPLTFPAAGSYVLDPETSTIRFATTHVFGAAVLGGFALVDGQVDVGQRPEDTMVQVALDAGSIDTGLKLRDAQLRGKRFLDADRLPFLTFSSTQLSGGPGSWRLPGVLAARGTSSPTVVLLASIAPTESGFTSRATARVDTRDFGLPSVPGVLGRFIDCTFDINAHLRTA
jgi:polyisoprenoid-binding protein YceI